MLLYKYLKEKFWGKIYAAGKKFAQPPVATNFKSEYVMKD